MVLPPFEQQQFECRVPNTKDIQLQTKSIEQESEKKRGRGRERERENGTQENTLCSAGFFPLLFFSTLTERTRKS